MVGHPPARQAAAPGSLLYPISFQEPVDPCRSNRIMEAGKGDGRMQSRERGESEKQE